jgi:exodeoxyribonuclease-3
MKIATWNVNGIHARQEDVFKWLVQDAPDIVCLQETKASRDNVPAALRDLDDYWGYWHGFKGYSGVALLVRRDLAPGEPKFEHPHFDLENRIVVAEVQGITVASIYVPNGGKNFPGKITFLKEMKAYAAKACGDFNVAHHDIDVHPKERGGFTGQLPEERALLDGILAGGGLTDLGRKMAPDDHELYTWWAPWRQMRQRNIGWRLDYIYTPQKLVKAAISCKVERETGTSDHGPVIAEFDDSRAHITRRPHVAMTAPSKSADRSLKQGELI